MPSVIGIDTGGTFTDLIAISADGSVRVAKHPSTPDAPMRAFLGVLEKSEIPFAEIERIVHGTTVATNAILQRTGANVMYVTTAGFEDIPFIQRINRKKAYDLHWLKPQPLVKRRNCLGVTERINAQGAIVVPLTAAALADLKTKIEVRLRNEAVEAIAVCLLFSYINPAHELEVGRFLLETFPDIEVSLSHRVAPIWREYERSSTLLADAFIKPLIQNYCHDIASALETNGVSGPCSFLKSDGGTTLLANAPERPVDILLSGLAGGIVGGKYFAQMAGFQNAITLDMGGTSCDVGLVIDGEQQFTTAFEIEWGLPVAIPIIEVRTLGAGGGSIAWIDKGGMLNVGPQSAGAVPGPACYGTGGTQPTVTDANLVLGRLNPEFFLGGELPLYPTLAEEAIEKLATQIGVSPQEAAMAIVEIADENMTNAIRLLTIERGIDPRDFVLVAFGGAGPLHALAIVKKLGMQTVVVPPHPGLCSAFGAAISELRVEKVHTFAARDLDVTDSDLRERFSPMRQEAREEIDREGMRGEPRETLFISMRYYQQNYEQDIEYRPEEGLTGAISRFHERHHQFYGYHFEDETIELVHLKVSISEAAHHPKINLAIATENVQHNDPRLVYESATDAVRMSVYRRGSLSVGSRFSGPAVIEEVDSTTFVPSGVELHVDENYNIILTLIEED
ncbi:MAG: hydantoinase/oxoprolinase family protein [Candidatus Poribacteria bacterium]|nr:hydantoinase/oxoprolinase family protein [Candidatus Poribacteria bacterium]